MRASDALGYDSDLFWDDNGDVRTPNATFPKCSCDVPLGLQHLVWSQQPIIGQNLW